AVAALEAAQERFALLVRAFDIGAAVLIGADHRDAAIGTDRFEETFLTLDRAFRTLGISQHQDTPAIAEQRGQMLAGKTAALSVVGCDKTDEFVALQTRI